jgi:hypothetical protein
MKKRGREVHFGGLVTRLEKGVHSWSDTWGHSGVGTVSGMFGRKGIGQLFPDLFFSDPDLQLLGRGGVMAGILTKKAPSLSPPKADSKYVQSVTLNLAFVCVCVCVCVCAHESHPKSGQGSQSVHSKGKKTRK